MQSCAAPSTSVAVGRPPYRPIICALVIVASWCSPVSRAGIAQVFPGDISPVRPIRIEGYWERTKAEAAVIGEIVLTADGRQRRTFGVTAIQAYKPAEEGMSVVRHSSLQPALLLRASDELIARLYGAKPTEKVTLLGTYGAGNGTLTLTSVDIAS